MNQLSKRSEEIIYNFLEMEQHNVSNDEKEKLIKAETQILKCCKHKVKERIPLVKTLYSNIKRNFNKALTKDYKWEDFFWNNYTNKQEYNKK